MSVWVIDLMIRFKFHLFHSPKSVDDTSLGEVLNIIILKKKVFN